VVKIGVVLSGCGVFDGSEIHEAVITLLALDRLGAEAVCMAPNTNQMHVVNHLSGELDILRQSRLLKVYVESFCNNSRPMTLGHISATAVLQVDGMFKWRQ